MRFSAYFFTLTVAMAQGCGSNTPKPSVQNDKGVKDVDDNVDSNIGGGTDDGDNGEEEGGGGGVESQSCVDNPTPFISVWRTKEVDEKVTLPLVTDAGDYDISIDWGGGEVLEVSSDGIRTATHTYAEAGEYAVKIEGHIGSAWSFGDALGHAAYPSGVIHTSSRQLISVKDLGSIGWESLKGAFRGAINLKKVAGGCTDEVTDMGGVFENILPHDHSEFKLVDKLDVDFSSWNFSSITSGDELANLFKDYYHPSATNYVYYCIDDCGESDSCKNKCDNWTGSLTTGSYSTLLLRLADTPENGGLRDDVVDVVMAMPARYSYEAVDSRIHLIEHHNFTLHDLGHAPPQ